MKPFAPVMSVVVTAVGSPQRQEARRVCQEILAGTGVVVEPTDILPIAVGPMTVHSLAGAMQCEHQIGHVESSRWRDVAKRPAGTRTVPAGSVPRPRATAALLPGPPGAQQDRNHRALQEQTTAGASSGRQRRISRLNVEKRPGPDRGCRLDDAAGGAERVQVAAQDGGSGAGDLPLRLTLVVRLDKLGVALVDLLGVLV